MFCIKFSLSTRFKLCFERRSNSTRKNPFNGKLQKLNCCRIWWSKKVFFCWMSNYRLRSPKQSQHKSSIYIFIKNFCSCSQTFISIEIKNRFWASFFMQKFVAFPLQRQQMFSNRLQKGFTPKIWGYWIRLRETNHFNANSCRVFAKSSSACLTFKFMKIVLRFVKTSQIR